MSFSFHDRCLGFLDAVPPDLRRTLPEGFQDQSLDFTSNDTLALSKHPALRMGALEAIDRYGAGSTGSRLLSGNHPLHAAVEARVAALKKTESALVFGGGFHTNASLLATVMALPLWRKPPMLMMDKWIHACWLQGRQDTPMVRYRHQDFDHLDRLIQQHRPDYTPVLLTESIFSMDGDITDLAALAGLKHRYPDMMIIVDEAHATGAWGPEGAGLVKPEHTVDLITGTFSKAMGCYGGYVACTAALKKVLVQKCAGLIYTTALPPMVLGAVKAALDLLPTLQSQRDHLYALAQYTREMLGRHGWNTGLSQSHIIPLMMGNSGACLALHHHLTQHRIGVSAIRPPTVPPKTARIRLSLRVDHQQGDIDQLVATMP